MLKCCIRTKWDTSIVVGSVHYGTLLLPYIHTVYFLVTYVYIKRHTICFNCFKITSKLIYWYKYTHDPLAKPHILTGVIKLWETGMYVYSCLDKLF